MNFVFRATTTTLTHSSRHSTLLFSNTPARPQVAQDQFRTIAISECGSYSHDLPTSLLINRFGVCSLLQEDDTTLPVDGMATNTEALLLDSMMVEAAVTLAEAMIRAQVRLPVFCS